MMIVRTFRKSSWNVDTENALKLNIWFKNEVDRAFQRWKGRTRADGRKGGRPGLGGCKGLILDPNDNCEDILEVLMKCRC